MYTPMFDKICDACGAQQIDVYEPVNAEKVLCGCGGTLERAFLPSQKRGVIGDDIDVWIHNGLCHADGSPRHFRSRAELKRAETSSRYSPHVEHLGSQGSDRSKHTTRWT